MYTKTAAVTMLNRQLTNSRKEAVAQIPDVVTIRPVKWARLGYVPNDDCVCLETM
jgi:hypothetical protein